MALSRGLGTEGAEGAGLGRCTVFHPALRMADGVAGESAGAGGPPSVPHLPGGLPGAPNAAVRPLLLQRLSGVPVPPPGLRAALPRVPAGGGW